MRRPTKGEIGDDEWIARTDSRRAALKQANRSMAVSNAGETKWRLRRHPKWPFGLAGLRALTAQPM
jgi:hypothetical protein